MIPTTFTRSEIAEGWPEPHLDWSYLKLLTDQQLANYIEVCGSEYDGMGSSVREALVRLLRR